MGGTNCVGHARLVPSMENGACAAARALIISFDDLFTPLRISKHHVFADEDSHLSNPNRYTSLSFLLLLLLFPFWITQFGYTGSFHRLQPVHLPWRTERPSTYG